ncbi:glycosyltransferase [Desulfuromonas sp. AOP6]|uniref:glycosyltransferase n=1 Tax=Desulfuromonas sp. AOP6 TaxID=1566351 RepID=UPI001277603D|nr:glycosyltransferase [Desulfuromonas sp. AOP6]BCA79498.1 hypothetical protein AOP6_1285 [Desulfuromonas sp. AOP6]
MNKYSLINFGYNPWSDFWKRNQTIFYFLTKENIIGQSYFINTPVWPMDLITNPKAELAQPKVNNWKAMTGRKSNYFKGKIITPVVLPMAARNSCFKKVGDYILERNLIDISSKNTILLVNRPDSWTRSLVERRFSDVAIKIFDWSDDFEQFTDDEATRKTIRDNVQYHISSSDIVLCVNDKLGEFAKKINPNSQVVKNATNYFTFEWAYPVRVRAFRTGRPLIGYMGWINELRLDEQLIEYLAKSRPEWDFVFVGPKSHEDALARLSARCQNVHLRDPVPYSNIPWVLSQFDVCILPNLLNKHTAGNDPIKYFDYLASGKPIVSTDTAGAEYLAGYIEIAHDKQQFLDKISDCLSHPKEERERVAFGRLNSWSNRFNEVRELIYEALARNER